MGQGIEFRPWVMIPATGLRTSIIVPAGTGQTPGHWGAALPADRRT